MKIKIYLSALAIAVAVFGFGRPADATALKFRVQTSQIQRCTVNDATGTPLNVRSTPNGKKTGVKLKNGTRVFVQYFSGDEQDRSWAEVRLSGKKNAKALGWVLQDLLECE